MRWRTSVALCCFLMVSGSGSLFAQRGAAPAGNTELPELPKTDSRGFLGVLAVSAAEAGCREKVGTYVAWEQLFKGCVLWSVSEIILKDPDYEFQLKPGRDDFTLSAVPRHAGTGGFLSDGKKIYYNSSGPASSSSQPLYDLTDKDRVDRDIMFLNLLQSPEPAKVEEAVLTAKPRELTPSAGEEASTDYIAYLQATRPIPQQLKTTMTALTWMLGVSVAEESCKEKLGTYVAWDKLAGECGGVDHAELLKDADYEFQLKPGRDEFTLSAVPRHAKLGGYLSDGKRVYYNPTGPASSSNQPIYHLGSKVRTMREVVGLALGMAMSEAVEQGKVKVVEEAANTIPARIHNLAWGWSATSLPGSAFDKNGKFLGMQSVCPPETLAEDKAQQAPRARKVWTDEDVRTLRTPAATQAVPTQAAPTPPPVEACVLGETGPAHRFTAEERRALQYICAIGSLEFGCSHDLNKAYTLAELVAEGVPNNRGTRTRLPRDPRLDADYEFRLEPHGRDYILSIIPKHPGIGGFFLSGGFLTGDTNYNANGEATNRDPLVAYQVSCADIPQ